MNDKGVVGSESKKFIKELEKLGVRFSFASGRLHTSLKDIAIELEIDAPLISLDGSLIKDVKDQKIVYESFLKKRHVAKAIKYAEEYLINIALCHSDAIYYTEANSLIPKVLNKYGARYKETDSYEGLMSKTLEIVFAADRRSTLSYVRDKMSFPYTLGCSTSFYRSQRIETLYYLEVNKAGSSKGKALQRLLKYFKLKPSQVAVIGDWYNDISLFDRKCYNVAICNAIPELKRNAHLVTKNDNNNDGVAEFLKLLYKAKKAK